MQQRPQQSDVPNAHKGVFDVGALSEPKRHAAWADILYDQYYPLDVDCRGHENYRGNLVTLDLPAVRLGMASSDPMDVYRRKSHLSRAASDYYFIPIPQMAPIAVRQHGREAALPPGSFSLISIAETYQFLQSTQNAILTLRIEGRHARERIPLIDDLAASRFSHEHALIRIFVDFVRSALTQSEGLDKASTEALTAQLLDLFALAISAPVQALESSETSVRLAHLRRILHAIENRLDDPALSAGSLAGELGLSERYIQKMFAEREETVSGVIRARRIAAAKRRLADPTRLNLSVAAIGYSVGFYDPGHFSRTFRQLVGMPPGEYRRQQTGKAGAER